MAAPDLHNGRHGSLKQVGGLVIIALGKCLGAAAKIDCGRTRRQTAASLKRFQLRQSCLQRIAVRCRRHQSMMEIGEVCPRPREESVSIFGCFHCEAGTVLSLSVSRHSSEAQSVKTFSGGYRASDGRMRSLYVFSARSASPLSTATKATCQERCPCK